MRTLVFVIMLVSMICACTKESNVNLVVNLTKVEGYEINYEPISREVFEEMFKPGWYCSSVHDVYPDGSLGENYLTMYSSNGGHFGPNKFSVCGNNLIKVYSFFEDFSGEYYNYRYATCAYSEESNYLSFQNYYSVYYSNPKVYVSLTGGHVTSLTETQMDLVAPLWKYGEFAAEGAVFTLFRFKRLTEEKVAQLDSLHTEEL